SRRRRRGPMRSLVLLLVAGAAVGGAGWGLWNLTAGEPAEAADQHAAHPEAAADPLALAPTTPIAPANAAPAPARAERNPQSASAPVVLEMGRPSDNEAPARDPLARPANETTPAPAPAPTP